MKRFEFPAYLSESHCVDKLTITSQYHYFASLLSREPYATKYCTSKFAEFLLNLSQLTVGTFGNDGVIHSPSEFALQRISAKVRNARMVKFDKVRLGQWKIVNDWSNGANVRKIMRLCELRWCLYHTIHLANLNHRYSGRSMPRATKDHYTPGVDDPVTKTLKPPAFLTGPVWQWARRK